MANIAVDTAGKIDVVRGVHAIQHTFVAAEAIVAGAPCRIDTSSGKATNSNGTTTAEARVWGIALRSAAANEPVTLVRRGILDGFDLSGMNYDAAVYLSDTDGRIADAAGTVSTVIGRVLPAFGELLGVAAGKLLSVEL